MKVGYVWLSLIIIAAAGIVYYTRMLPPHDGSNPQDPFQNGVYSTGIVESYQENGSNINMYPEVNGTVTKIYLQDGADVKKGDPILAIDDSVQRELVAKDQAQIELQQANLENVRSQFEKINKARRILRPSVSENTVDNSSNSISIAKQNVNVAVAQYETDKALLDKYIIYAPVDGKVIKIAPATGNYVSTQGTYDTYTQTMMPVIVMQQKSEYLQVRCFLDEILVPNLPPIDKVQATLFVRGRKTNGIPLQFVYLQPFTNPKTQLSDERQERVDVRVLPIIYRFTPPNDMQMFPGQLVDIYLKG